MATTSEQPDLRVPFPVIGGKRKVAPLVWSRLGDVRNYVEPFAFGAAMLLGRPGGAGPIETINDLNAYVPNFWRAVQHDPEAVAAHADWPVSEADMHARHRWLVTSDAAVHALSRIREDPDYYDARMAGWWAWGACCWIGTGWCDDGREEGSQIPAISATHRTFITSNVGHAHRPELERGGRGITGTAGQRKRPRVPSSVGGYMPGVINGLADGKRPQLCNGNTTAGPGVLRHVDDGHRPQLADQFARGRSVNANDNADTCRRRREWLTDWMLRLADRMRPVRVCCGHWARVCDSDSTLTRLGLTGVFLDPPYRPHIKGKANRAKRIYANDMTQDVNALCDEVQAWCVARGSDPLIRIALCGLEGEYPDVEAAGWQSVPWKSSGYQNRTEAGRENAARERIWFSPACVATKPEPQAELWAVAS